MIPEKENLLDKDKRTCHALLKEDTDTAKALGARNGWSQLVWGLGFEKSNEAQKKYLEDKFNRGQQTGHKQDPERVAKDMRFARKADGSRLFSSKEFLSAQQIQSFFSRMASKLRQVAGISDLDIRAT